MAKYYMVAETTEKIQDIETSIIEAKSMREARKLFKEQIKKYYCGDGLMKIDIRSDECYRTSDDARL